MLQILRTWYLRVKYATQHSPRIYEKIKAVLDENADAECPFCRHRGGVHNQACYLPRSE